MEMQLAWACKLDRVEPLWISRVGHTVLTWLMESQILHLPAGSVVLSIFLSGRKLSSSSCLDARHFNSSLGSLVPFKLLPRC